VAVVGGSIVGSCTALFLKRLRPSAVVRVVERDLGAKLASTTRSVGGLRRQFSLAENIRLSSFISDRFFDVLGERGEVEQELSFVQDGYLFLAATNSAAEVLKENHVVQKLNHDAEVRLMTKEQTAPIFPWMNVEDIVLASLGCEREGWIDPWSLLTLVRRKCKQVGVEFVADEVKGFEKESDGRISALDLRKNGLMKCDIVAICAGAWSGHLGRLAGFHIPVEPRIRRVFAFDCREAEGVIQQCPLTVDPSGVYFRGDSTRGSGKFLCGKSPTAENDFDMPGMTEMADIENLFNETNEESFEEIWEVLAHRVKYFETLKVTSSWLGFYDYNSFDQNAILGNLENNIFIATGFSGHGLQQAPGAGLTLAEMILGLPQTIDIGDLTPERIRASTPFPERNIV